MGTLYKAALVFVIIGAVNWGLIGFFQFDLVASIFGGQDSFLARTIYAIVGIAGIICIPILTKSLDDDNSYATNASTTNTNRTPYRQGNYQTEFGKEKDFSSNNNNKSKKSNSYDPYSNSYSNNGTGAKKNNNNNNNRK